MITWALQAGSGHTRCPTRQKPSLLGDTPIRKSGIPILSNVPACRHLGHLTLTRSCAASTGLPTNACRITWLLLTAANRGDHSPVSTQLGYGGYGLSVLSRPAPSILAHRHEAPQRGDPAGALRTVLPRRLLAR